MKPLTNKEMKMKKASENAEMDKNMKKGAKKATFSDEVRKQGKKHGMIKRK